MSNNWKQEYEKLTHYVSEHPEIIIKQNQIRLPKDIREGFYTLFDATRKAIVSETMSEALDDTRKLLRSYHNAEQEAISLLNMQSITSQTTLQRFMDDLDDWLSRELFEPLFNLLKGTIDAQQLENICAGIIRSSVPVMYERAYGKWVAVSMIKLLEADELLTIPLPIMHPRDRAGVGGKGTTEPVRVPQKSDSIDFEYLLGQLFTIPDFIVHSASLNKYVGIRTQYEDSLAEADNASNAKEWYPIKTVGDTTSGMMLLYIADKAADIAIIADRVKICRPDVIMECRTQPGWYTKEDPGIIPTHSRSLKPVFGTYVITELPVPADFPVKPEDNISFLNVGLDSSKLEPVVEAVKAQKQVPWE